MKQVWQCADGRVFQTMGEAAFYEKDSFSSWLAEMPCMELSSIWHSLSNSGEDEFYGTDRDFAKVFMDQAHKMWLENPKSVTFKRRNALPEQNND